MRLENKYSEPDCHNLVKDQLLTPNEAATKLKVTPEQVRSLIRKNQLLAINISTGSKRPLYRISQKSLNDFLNSRGRPRALRHKKKTKRRDPVRDFFPHLK
jgi:hypothetical protein